MQEGQCTIGWFKLPAHPHLLDVETAIGVVSLDLFCIFNHIIDMLVLLHQIHDKIDVMSDCDKERYTLDEHELRG